MKTPARLASVAVLAGAVAVTIANAQSVLPAHSGTLHYSEGKVTIDGQLVEEKVGKFSEIKENATLKTEAGRAEVLLTPGVFLRVGENSSIRMLDKRLVSTRVELLEGTVMLESEDPDVSSKDPAVTLVYRNYEIQPVKYGLFEISTENGLKVYKGQASVVAGSNHTVVKDGRLMAFSETLAVAKFDDKQGDDLYLWTRDRSAYLSAANMSSAGLLARRGYGSGFSGYLGSGLYNGFGGGWYYNPYLSLYTYMPFNSVAWSPFGFGYYSPIMIYQFYTPGRYFWSGGGASRGVALNQTGTSAVAASQVNRLGAGLVSHPTLGSPIRAAGGPSPTNGAAYRGGFGGPRGGFGGFGGPVAGPSFSGPSGGGGGGFGGGGGGGGVPASSGAIGGAMAGHAGGAVRGGR